MAVLPTTNLTAHFDASSNDDVINDSHAGASDGNIIEEWEDDDGKDLSFWYVTDNTTMPTYRVSVPLMRGACLDFDGATDHMRLWNSAGSVAKTFANVFGASAKTLLVAFYVEAFGTNAASSFDNDCVIGDGSQFFGLHLKTNLAVAYNWDGSDDHVDLAIAVNTSYVAMVRHNGTNLFLSINNGTESSTASGATTTTTGQIILGRNVPGGSAFFNGRIGEVAMYNVDLATQGSDLATAQTYFNEKWVTGSVSVATSLQYSSTPGYRPTIGRVGPP